MVSSQSRGLNPGVFEKSLPLPIAHSAQLLNWHWISVGGKSVYFCAKKLRAKKLLSGNIMPVPDGQGTNGGKGLHFEYHLVGFSKAIWKKYGYEICNHHPSSS